jgi:hypothetical protein
MLKPAITALLALLCLFLVKANVDTFRTPLPLPQEADSVSVKKKSAKKIGTKDPVLLNPVIPRQLPDLNSGYLFNAERFLAKETRSTSSNKGQGKNIRIEDVVFSGALLGEGYKKALVTYDPGPQPIARTTRGAPRRQAVKESQTILLTEGDELAGYTLKEITPDFILFTKGSDTIKKTLFDPDKKRQQLSPRPQSSPTPTITAPSAVPARRPTPPVAPKP